MYNNVFIQIIYVMNSEFRKIVFCSAFLSVVVNAQFDWTYGTGPTGIENWKEYCTAFDQSPIDLNTSAAEYMGESRAVVEINEMTPITPLLKFTLDNEGRLLYVDIPSDTWSVTLNSDAPNRYGVLYVIYHWGSNSSVGSEHRINGKRYALEMQIVAYDKVLYASPNVASREPKGLSIISVLFDESASASDLKKQGQLLEKLEDVQNPKTKSKIDYFDPEGLLPTNRKRFFRYQGSATTPPCVENVQWTVFESTLAVSEDQLKLFRNMKYTDKSPMQNNFRPVQSLNPLGISQPRVLFKSWNGTVYLSLSWILLVLSFLISVI